MLNRLLSTALWLTIIFPASAQGIDQTIKGRILDSESKFPLMGVNIVLTSDTTQFRGTTTDLDGYYRLDDVSIGRQAIRVTYMGYQERVVSNIIVNSGKEVVLNLEMEESTVEMETVEVTANRKAGVINEMTTVSTRTFSVEETERYSGSRADPARMASNFAGVSGSDDSRNDLVVRGNSPLGVVWKMEGVNIPNPNHFAISGSTGGPVNILNNKVLSSSDFMTGAFPAEYGNGIAGVFDLRMRNGNHDKSEFTGQFGFLGTELSAEGPISKKSRTSYLVSYRYSSLAAFSALGIDIGTSAIPKYQDASFKLNFPLNNTSNLSFFGVGGTSDIDIVVSSVEHFGETDIYADSDRDQYFGSSMGIVGMNYSRSFNENTYGKFTLAHSVNEQHTYHDLVYRHIEIKPDFTFVVDSLVPKLGYQFTENKTSASFFINHKFNRKNTLKFGTMVDRYDYSFIDSSYSTSLYVFQERWNYNGDAMLIQPYVQLKHKFNDKYTLTAGLHEQYFTLNGSQAIEPRIGLRWKMTNSQALSAGFGMHSQIVPSYVFFYKQPGSPTHHNEDIGFIKSNHYIVGYDNSLQPDLRIRVEAYYQSLYNIPVEKRSSSFSLLNQGAGFDRFFPDTLVNTGTANNLGVEFTLEKFFSKTYFFMLTASVFDSKYKGSDGVERDTDFNGKYAVNLMGAKEFTLGRQKNKVLSLGAKITVAGGKLYGPVDSVATSVNSGDIIFIDSTRNSLRFDDYFRTDLKIVYRINSKKLTHEFGLDIINVLDTKNILKLTYIPDVKGPLREEYQLGRLPIFYYRIDF
ncbi:MAG: TonB-dependent receptor [Bacteroidetes bacterium]|nr:TonB-dependent receptor [Bacteroidota bacterium]